MEKKEKIEYLKKQSDTEIDIAISKAIYGIPHDCSYDDYFELLYAGIEKQLDEEEKIIAPFDRDFKEWCCYVCDSKDMDEEDDIVWDKYKAWKKSRGEEIEDEDKLIY